MKRDNYPLGYSDRLPNSVCFLDNVNYQHMPAVLSYLRRLGVKVIHNARYNPRSAAIEAAFGEMKKYVKYHIPLWLWNRNPEAALRIAMRSISSENARAYFRAACPAGMRRFDQYVRLRAFDEFC
eukprot:COSAG02_NODE_1936_length_10314_cov_6.250024_3_plen_125_part_00